MPTQEQEGRQVRAVFANYRRQVVINGETRVGQASKMRGDFITDFAPGEEARLDSLNALIPSGREGDPAEIEARLLREAMARALNPTDVTRENFGPPASVSPPSLGQEPRGEFTTGDTGLSDETVQAQSGGGTSPGTLVRADAPEVEDTAALAEFIRTGGDGGKPLTGPETVALAEDDPDRAKHVLAAEKSAQGGDPRGNVEGPLSKIIGG